MPRPATPIGQLTEREEDVARLMARGYTNPQIAEELGITFATAKWYVSQVIARLDATSREEAAEIWRQEQRVPARLRRGFAAMATGAFLRRVAIGLGAATAVGVGALVMILAIGSGHDHDAGTDSTPTIGATEPATTTPVVAAGPCDDANLVNGFLVIGEGATPPDCTGLASSTPVASIPPDGKRYELEVPPGPWEQSNFDAVTLPAGIRLDGALYTNSQTGAPAFAVYRHIWSGFPGRVVEGTNPRPVDYLPGPGVVVDRLNPTTVLWPEADGTLGPRSTAVYWSEGDETFGAELFESSGANLTIEQLVGLLVFFNQTENRADYWSLESDDFVQRAPWLYPDDVDTGFDYINTIIQRFTPGGDPVSDYWDPIQAPCVAAPGVGLVLPPACPGGVAEGTLVDAYISGGCPDQRGAVDAINLTSGALQRVWLYAIEKVEDPGDLVGLKYVAAFTSGERVFSVGLTDSGIAGIWGGGVCANPQLADWARSVDSWLLPPLYPLPD